MFSMVEKIASGNHTVLPPHHPLFLHQSETQGLSIISHVLTGGENYVVWSRAMQIALRGKRKIGFIDGTCTKDSQESHLRDQWDQCNVVVLSWLLNSVSWDIANSVIFHQEGIWFGLISGNDSPPSAAPTSSPSTAKS